MHRFEFQSLDRPPRRRRAPSPPGLDLEPISVLLGLISAAIGLGTLAMLALPSLDLDDQAPWAFKTVEVPVRPDSRIMEEVAFPSEILLIPPTVGALVAIGGIGGRRGRGVPIGPIVGIVSCAVSVACWWGVLIWFSTTYGPQGIGIP